METIAAIAEAEADEKKVALTAVVDPRADTHHQQYHMRYPPCPLQFEMT